MVAACQAHVGRSVGRVREAAAALLFSGPRRGTPSAKGVAGPSAAPPRQSPAAAALSRAGVAGEHERRVPPSRPPEERTGDPSPSPGRRGKGVLLPLTCRKRQGRLTGNSQGGLLSGWRWGRGFRRAVGRSVGPPSGGAVVGWELGGLRGQGRRSRGLFRGAERTRPTPEPEPEPEGVLLSAGSVSGSRFFIYMHVQRPPASIARVW